MSVLKQFASNNYGIYNKSMAKILGLHEAIMLGELISEFDYWEKTNNIKDNTFFSTVENIENNTTLTDYQQRKCLNKLKEIELISVSVKGIPAKRYITLNTVNIEKFIACIEEILKQDLKKLNTQFLRNLITSGKETKELYNSNNKTIIKNNNKINTNLAEAKLCDIPAKKSTPKKKYSKHQNKENVWEQIESSDIQFKDNIKNLIWSYYVDRIDKGERITETQVGMQLEEFRGKPYSEMFEALHNAITGGYKKIYFPKSQGKYKKNVDTAINDPEEAAKTSKNAEKDSAILAARYGG